MVSFTKQDMQSVIDTARSRLQERMATRQDVHALQETVKALAVNLQQSQQLLRQDEYQSAQLVRKSASMESRMVQLEHELQNVRRAMVQLSQHHPTERITERVVMTQSENGQLRPTGRYSFNTTG